MKRTSFINVDVDVYSTQPLRVLAAAMEQAAAVTLHCGRVAPGRYHASFELGHTPRSADSAIRGFARLVDGLASPARKLWDTATRRDFSVGIEAGQRPFSFTSAVQPSTVAMVSRCRARISFVIYASRNE